MVCVYVFVYDEAKEKIVKVYCTLSSANCTRKCVIAYKLYDH